MKRRDFLAAGAFTLAGGLAPNSLWVRRNRPPVRAAIVIGVDRAGNLPRLSAATSGASSVASWLRGEGFDVNLLIDDQQPVTASQVFNAIAAVLQRGTADQLVVYFSGHGFNNAYSEFWMLSGSPGNPNEAISVSENVILARESGIPNIAFISDACRSTTDSLGASRVRGSIIFPSLGPNNVVSDVDLFYATLVGKPSYEVPLPTSTSNFAGIYTSTFLEAFAHPDDTMVRTVSGLTVVPNRRLKSFLSREVQKRARAASIQLEQRPDTQVCSGDDVYIGRVSAAARHPIDVATSPTIQDVAGAEFARIGARALAATLTTSPGISTESIARVATNSGFDADRSSILSAKNPQSFETQTGFALTGAQVSRVVSHPSISAHVLPPLTASDPTTLVRVDTGNHPAASVAIEFADGSGTVLAALHGFIGSVVVDHEGVSNVSYIPSRNNYRWGMYSNDADRIKELHAAVATAAKYGVFRIEANGKTGSEAARQLAGTIRVAKGLDPTLGIYAAYAYADAGLSGDVRSVRDIMRSDLGFDLHDVAMLAGGLPSGGWNGGYVFPFCPMLTQGWGQLRVRNVSLQPPVAQARDHLRPSLWTTFDATGMHYVIPPLGAGALF